MMDFAAFDRRPIVIAIAGPNGAGKTTLFHANVASCGPRFVNTGVLASELRTEPYDSARLLEAKGVSQADLHRATRIPKSTISKVLAGEKPFSRPIIRKRADYFQVDQSVLAANS